MTMQHTVVVPLEHLLVLRDWLAHLHPTEVVGPYGTKPFEVAPGRFRTLDGAIRDLVELADAALDSGSTSGPDRAIAETSRFGHEPRESGSDDADGTP